MWNPFSKKLVNTETSSNELYDIPFFEEKYKQYGSWKIVWVTYRPVWKSWTFGALAVMLIGLGDELVELMNKADKK